MVSQGENHDFAKKTTDYMIYFHLNPFSGRLTAFKFAPIKFSQLKIHLIITLLLDVFAEPSVCGKDKDLGNCYEHRRKLIVDRQV